MPQFDVHVAKKGFGWLFKGIYAPSKTKAMQKGAERWDEKMKESKSPVYQNIYKKYLERPYRITVFTPSRAIYSMLMKRASEQKLKEVV